MIILTETTDLQSLSFIGKGLSFDSYRISDYSTGLVSTSVSFTQSTIKGVSSITDVLTIKDGNTYVIEVLNGLETIYIGWIYCTNQTIDEFSINNAVYTTNDNTVNNDFIII